MITFDPKDAYEGVDDVSKFTNANDLDAYRDALLYKSEPEAKFIKQLIGDKKVDILEVGCGNGRTLFSLVDNECVNTGFGIDISSTRAKFAEKWAVDWGYEHLEFAEEDITQGFEGDTYNVVLCLTGAFQYFANVNSGLDSQVLDTIRDTLRPQGILVLELYYIPPEREQLLKITPSVKLWHQLEEGDPWKYYLEEFRYTEKSNTLYHGKTFIGHNGELDEGRFEILRYYSRPEIQYLLTLSGFKDVKFHGPAFGTPHSEVIVAYN